ncbi:MAG TPA: FAD-dependent monooxygenase [Streptosporangiaceae bacterium]|nr:FAD-dependent monooxygenase [Streptosporangiaceae bacterium]
MSKSGMRVAVVGAGIAGLTVAAALRKTGVQCRVYERAPRLAEIGAGIQLSPNATSLLARLGIAGELRSVAVRPEAIEMHRWDSGDLLMRTVLGQTCEDLFGAPYYCLHRADLHSLLVDLLPAGVLRLDAHCVSVTDGDDGAEIRFADGSVETADVVVGADGIRSVVRETLVSDEPRFAGQTIYRGLISADLLPQLLKEPKVLIWLGPGQHCVCYPISAGRSISFVATTPAAEWRTESWTENGRIADVTEAYQGWNGEVQALLSNATTVTRWALHDRAPIDHWSGRRVTLVGDAAHPMLPFGAQGANQAIEDAVALAACLRDVRPADLPQALWRYEAVRRPRTEYVQQAIQKNARNHHFADGEDQRDRDRTMDENWGLRGQEWLFGYDAELAVTQ